MCPDLRELLRLSTTCFICHILVKNLLLATAHGEPGET